MTENPLFAGIFRAARKGKKARGRRSSVYANHPYGIMLDPEPSPNKSEHAPWTINRDEQALLLKLLYRYLDSDVTSVQQVVDEMEGKKWSASTLRKRILEGARTVWRKKFNGEVIEIPIPQVLATEQLELFKEKAELQRRAHHAAAITARKPQP
jgi:hypothetical protein